jgi:hypothetical protein
MSDPNEKKSFPTPAVATQRVEQKSLDLEHVDMSKGGAQGNVFVSKGTASTVVSLMPEAKARKR